MQAIQGVYDNGKFTLERKAPVKQGKIIVIFPDETHKESKMSAAEALRILDKYKGSIKGNFDAENEKDEYMRERYELTD